MRPIGEILSMLSPAEKAWLIIGTRKYNWTAMHVIEFIREKTGEEAEPSSVEDYLRQNKTTPAPATTDSPISVSESAEYQAFEATFGLERDLQIALRSNIQQLEAGLTIIDNGKEQKTDAGFIDITARDEAGTTVVIELKAGKAEPQALTQLLAYMGVIGKHEKKPVRGVLIAGDFHPRLVFAAQGLPNVQLRKYHFKFTFETVE